MEAIARSPSLLHYPCKGQIIFLHGTGNDAVFPQWPLFHSLLTVGYQVISSDLPGHGRLSSSLFTSEARRNFCTELLRYAASVRKDLTFQDTVAPNIMMPVYLIGHSLGAALAVQYLLHEDLFTKERLAGFVAISLPLQLRVTPASILLEAASPLLPSFWKFVSRVGLAEALPAFGPYRRSEFPIRFPGARQSFGYLEPVADVLRDIAYNASAKPIISIPGLVLRGKLDSIATAADTDEVGARFQRMKQVALPWENHYTGLLAQSTTDVVVKWLDQQTDLQRGRGHDGGATE